MFTLDSDIMGILMALLTFLIPVISAALEKRRKRNKEAGTDNLPDNEPLFELQILEPQEEVVEEIEEEIEEEAVEEIEKEATSVEEPRKGLKERLKENPKDMVLFSEILNPKFKEY